MAKASKGSKIHFGGGGKVKGGNAKTGHAKVAGGAPWTPGSGGASTTPGKSTRTRGGK